MGTSQWKQWFTRNKGEPKVRDYSEFYWKFIPHYRAVEDFADEDEDIVSLSEDDAYFESLEVNPDNYEFRDEAGRDKKWWKLFDEYEYRYSKKVRDNQDWWRWFDKGTTVQERKTVTKLDCMIIPFAIMSYWSKNLDQTNVQNAYVSGMKEDLHMWGNEYANALSMYNAGSVIFQVMYMWLFPRVQMHLMFFSADVLWSLVTVFTAFIQTPQQLMACRFLVGAFEAGYFMMIHYLLGSWYTASELGRRGGLYYCGQMLGNLTSGLLSGKIYEVLNHVGGRAGWRWIFLIDGCITIPIGFFALYLVPGTPQNCCSLFLTDEDIKVARRRLKRLNIKTPTKEAPPFFNWQLWKNVLTSWRIYVLMLLDYFFWNAINTGYSGYALWLKDLDRYSIPHLNRLTSIPPALGVFYILAVCFSADILKSRTFAIFWAELFVLTGNIILIIWDVAESAKWFAFMTGYFGITVSSVIYGWLNDIMRYDPQERSIVLCWCNMFANQSVSWTLRLVFPTVEAPRYRKGYIYVACNSAALTLWTFVTLFFYKRQEKKDAKSNGIILYNSEKGEIPSEVSKWLDSEGKVISREEYKDKYSDEFIKIAQDDSSVEKSSGRDSEKDSAKEVNVVRVSTRSS